MKLKRLAKSAQSGFTIVELMVATLVFSTILIVITVGVLYFTNSYYKGVNSSATQSTARSVITAVTQAIEFGGGYFGSSNVPTDPTTLAPGTKAAYCIGDKQFDFVLGNEINSSQADALYQSINGNGSSCVATAGSLTTGAGLPAGSAGGQELLGSSMRLSRFSIVRDGTKYTVTVKVSYGDDDLLTTTHGQDPTASCVNTTGSQFCATAELTTTVQSRVGDN